ncbi:RND family transporter [Planctomycetota bacterium]
MDLRDRITDTAVRHARGVTLAIVIFTAVTGALIPRIKVDTDPENMLSEHEPVRVFHHATKEQFALHDMVVVGIVNEEDPNGVFSVRSLDNIYALTEYAKTLVWPDPQDPAKQIGVIEVDLLAPSTVDHIGQEGPGTIRFEWLMARPPTTEAEARAIRDKALSNPLLKGTLVSEDGKALCVYLPLTHKDLSHEVSQALKKKIATFKGQDQYHITGLPVAEDTFGYEMFIQMAISAPLAMLTIFILMLLFFRKLVLIVAPLIVAMVSVITTMGLLIGFGYPVHIMSSMIPIFLMPIAVVDSVHILSEFFDLFTAAKGKEQTIRAVLHELFVPMLYTSLTSAAGFLSLALTPIPPVQVFGIFVAVGIMIAWVVTVIFVPAYIMFIPDKAFANFGLMAQREEKQTWLMRVLHGAGRLTYTQAKPIVVVFLGVIAVAVYGMTRIRINDNPVKWFEPKHPIRVADTVLNKHFGGTYMAYLVLESNEPPQVTDAYLQTLGRALNAEAARLQPDFAQASTGAARLQQQLAATAAAQPTREALLTALAEFSIQQGQTPGEQASEELWFAWTDFFELQHSALQPFKRPDVLRYLAGLQAHLERTFRPDGSEPLVGKSSSVADVVRKVYQELLDGQPENYRIPDSAAGVAQCLIQFQSSHNPDDLWHLVTPDYNRASLWLQLTSGDNRDMEALVREVGVYLSKNKPPMDLNHNWAGLTYINVVWQNKMVWGMLQSFLGSFVIVFIMMALLFRSALWGLLCMVPLTITIAAIYGIIGLIGKDYDMPVAVLSALTLGMAVDFAIHFLERARLAYRHHGSWEKAVPEMFGEPARAITRNVLVIAIGFLPLLAAPLVPYKTVGIFLCAIMALSGIVTLLVLPALMRLWEGPLFKTLAQPMRPSCNCAFCAVIAAAGVVLLALNVYPFGVIERTRLFWISGGAIVVLALLCGMLSRRRVCHMKESVSNQTSEV